VMFSRVWGGIIVETMDTRIFEGREKRQMYSVGVGILPQKSGQNLLRIMSRNPEGWESAVDSNWRLNLQKEK